MWDKRVYYWTVPSPGWIQEVQNALALAKVKADELGIDTSSSDWLEVEARDEFVVFLLEIETKPERSGA